MSAGVNLTQGTARVSPSAEDGAYLHWTKADIHLDLEDARVYLDAMALEGG